MSCYRPLQAYRSFNKKTENGKAYITFNPTDAGFHYEKVFLPCGQCIGCRIDRSRQWALRCVHEASLHSDNCFITLTFDDAHLNVSGSLIKSDFQNFMKRLRFKFRDVRIRFFHCGEYGSQLSRPHHHAALFGFDFPDKVLWSVRDGIKLFRSAILEELWPYGFSTVGGLSYESAAYIARYCTKKVNGEKSRLHYCTVDDETGEMTELEPEYITMSRRPGIARDWIEEHIDDVYPKDFVTHKGRKYRPPKYYDKIYDVKYPDSFLKIKKIRLTNMRQSADNNTYERLAVRERVQKAKFKSLKREYERV
nr:MAG: replication initiator protein [Microvirus sp.]